jgi:hypothetical protein
MTQKPLLDDTKDRKEGEIKWKKRMEDDEFLKYKTRKAKFLQETSSCISCVHIYDRIWVGNVGSGLAVLNGTLGNFGAVFNASSYEREGVDYEDEYASLGILYDTAWDKETGNTFSDAPFATVDEIANWIYGLKDSKVFVFPGGKKHEVNVRGYNTKSAFVNTVIAAATAIKRMEDELAIREKQQGKKKQMILVHCMAGVNRSVSCIVAYLMKFRGITLKDAKEMVTTANRRRKAGALKNHVFKKALQGGIARLDEAKMREMYLGDVAKIKQTITELSGGKEKGEQGTPCSKNIFKMAMFDRGGHDEIRADEGTVGDEFCESLTGGCEDDDASSDVSCCAVCGIADVPGMMKCYRCGSISCSRDCHILHAIAPETCKWSCHHRN